MSGLAQVASGTSDVRVTRFAALPAPADLAEELPADRSAQRHVETSRSRVRDVLHGLDDRLLVIVGPCSIHDPEAGMVYAERLASAAAALSCELVVIMRTYFEKPRTTVGWKGLINDPRLDGSHDIAAGLRTARRFLLDVTALGLATATEFLEPISPQYLADLISWGAIGARTTESQIHRQLASGLSMPIGFKNGTDGSVQMAIDGCTAARSPQTFLGIDHQGRAALVGTAGNPDTHLILRGSSSGPNYSPAHVAAASAALRAAGANPRIMVDASHGNSGKDHERQAVVASELALQISRDCDARVAGVMLESFLEPGAQRLDVARGGAGLMFGRSVTDACMSWDVTERVLAELSEAVRRRRSPRSATGS